MSESSKPISGVSQALLAVAGGLAVYLAWVSLPWPLVHDAPLMHYVAWRISQGAVPYRDIFDMNSPGVYLIHLGVLKALGASDFAWRLFDLTWLAATALVVAAFARPWGRAAAIGGGLLFAVHHIAGGAWQAGQRDFLLCVFLLLGALGVARWADVERTRDLAWAGLALGVGITIKPHAAALAAALAIFLGVLTWQRRASPRGLAAFVAGGMVVPIVVVGWVGAAGGLGAWCQIVFGYLIPYYSRLAWPSHWQLPRGTVPLAFVVVATLTWVVVERRVGPRHVVALLGLAYGILHFVGQGKGWEYHFYPVAAFAAVFAFSAVEPALAARRLSFGVPLVGGLAALLFVLTGKGYEAVGVGADWLWDKERVVRQLASDLRPGLRGGDTVQVLDSAEGGIHALLRLGVAEPTRFLYDFHFYHDVNAPEIQELRAEFIRELDARPPRFIVLFDKGWPWGGADRVAQFPALDQRLTSSYALVTRRARYLVFAKRSGS